MKKLVILFLTLCCFVSTAAAEKKDNAKAIDKRGYVGTLPDINNAASKKITEQAEHVFEYKDGFNDYDSIKPVPRDNPAFVNIIIKKDKTSQYINDLNNIIQIVEDLQTIIEAKENVQIFNAKSNYLKENVNYIRAKYQNKAESSYISFKKLMDLNTHVQSIALLRQESEIYSPYLTKTQSGNLFSQNTIDLQLDYLLSEIKKTLTLLKETK